ncbi:MAG TPA: FecR domain-containing protein [Puia sp.]|nr:FecR domain-containing protein [Puia sp.]
MTTSDNRRFINLLHGFLAQSLSGEDLEEFFELAKLPEYRLLMEEIAERELREGSTPDVTDLRQAETAFQALEERLEKASAHKSSGSSIRFLRWVAAAVLLVLTTGGVYFFRKGRNHQEAAVSIAGQQDILPGHNGAILRLSGGRTIVLDSAADGTLAIEGSVRAQKVNGELFYTGMTGKALYNTVTTDRGRQWQLRLPDGTKVWLNASSSIRFPISFTGRERLVQMSGEAYFEVATNPQMPFRVQVIGKRPLPDTTCIRVLGTRFNVMAYSDEEQMKTTLLEGGISLENLSAACELKPDEQANLSYSNGKMTIARAIDPQQAVAWKNGFFQFDQADLKTVMRSVARWYDVDVEYREPIPVQYFGGKIQRNLTLNELLDVLAKSQVHFTVSGKTLTVTR